MAKRQKVQAGLKGQDAPVAVLKPEMAPSPAAAHDMEDAESAPATNSGVIVRQAYDPEDPDSVHITQVNQELGSLFSSEPGERVIPFPFAFQGDGEGLGKDFDNMNDGFLKSLKNPIEAHEGDGEDRLRWKQNILTARLALLDGIRNGISVKDSIREEYAFRVRAYEARSAYIRDLQSYAAEGPAEGDFADTLKAVNRQLSEQGIKKITADDVGMDGVVAGKGQEATE